MDVNSLLDIVGSQSKLTVHLYHKKSLKENEEYCLFEIKNAFPGSYGSTSENPIVRIAIDKDATLEELYQAVYSHLNIKYNGNDSEPELKTEAIWQSYNGRSKGMNDRGKSNDLKISLTFKNIHKRKYEDEIKIVTIEVPNSKDKTLKNLKEDLNAISYLFKIEVLKSTSSKLIKCINPNKYSSKVHEITLEE